MQRTKRRPHVQSPDLNQTKKTPRTRPTHEARHDGSLVNADPNRKYVLCPSDDQHPQNYAYYESIGYEIENATKDGVRILLGEKPVIGKPLMWRGCVLMSCSLERAQQIFEEGPTGNTGQKYYDNLMDQIKRNNIERRVQVSGTREEFDTEFLTNSPPEFRE